MYIRNRLGDVFMEKFHAINPIMLRTPTRCFNEYYNVFHSANADIEHKILNDKLFMNALKLANPSFYSYIELTIKEGKTISKDAFFSLVKFYSRFTTRSTPYAGYATIAMAEWDNSTNVILDNSFAEILQVDTQWLYKVVSIIEENPAICRELHIQANKNIFNRGTRIVNPYVSHCGNSANSELSSSIKNTKMTQQILKLAESPIRYGDLYSYILKISENVPPEVIHSYLQSLIKNEFLITNLRVVSSKGDPLLEIIRVLKDINLDQSGKNFLKKLCNIQEKLANICSIESDCFSFELDCILQEMSKIVQSNNYIYSYFRRTTKSAKLGYIVKKALEKINVLFEYIPYSDNEKPLVKNFKRFFIENYGNYAQVPLSRLISQFDITQRLSNDSTKTSIFFYLDSIILDAIKGNRSEVVVSGHDVV